MEQAAAPGRTAQLALVAAWKEMILLVVANQ